MSDQMLAEVHAMLTANARATGMMTIIDGWTLFQNSEAGPYVGLYNTHKGKRDGRVYVYGFADNNQAKRPLSADFKKLPQRLQDEVLALLAKEQPPEAPRSEFTEYVQQRNLLRKCQPFKVIRYKYAMLDDNGNKIEKQGEDKKDPWRIERCFDIGNNNRQPSAQQQPVQATPAKQQPVTQQQKPPVAQPMPVAAQQQQPVAQQKPVAGQQPKPDPDLEVKKKIIRSFSGVAALHYGDAGWQAAVLRIGQEIAGKELKGLTELTRVELERVNALVNLDAIGVEIYGNTTDWYAAIPVLLTEFGKQTVYDLTLAQIHKMASQLKKSKPTDQLDEDIPFG